MGYIDSKYTNGYIEQSDLFGFEHLRGRRCRQRFLKHTQTMVHRRQCLTLHISVMGDQFLSEFGEYRVTAAGPAMLFSHGRFVEHFVDAVHQQPSAAVGHVHAFTGGRDGTVPVDQFKEFDLARPERAVGAKIDPQGQMGTLSASARAAGELSNPETASARAARRNRAADLWMRCVPRGVPLQF